MQPLTRLGSLGKEDSKASIASTREMNNSSSLSLPTSGKQKDYK